MQPKSQSHEMNPCPKMTPGPFGEIKLSKFFSWTEKAQNSGPRHLGPTHRVRGCHPWGVDKRMCQGSRCLVLKAESSAGSWLHENVLAPVASHLDDVKTPNLSPKPRTPEHTNTCIKTNVALSMSKVRKACRCGRSKGAERSWFCFLWKG